MRSTNLIASSPIVPSSAGVWLVNWRMRTAELGDDRLVACQPGALPAGFYPEVLIRIQRHVDL